ncbi:CpaF family protein [Effusibacillus consociatus]|uniref:CpaF family protein n=1 Tax=Effusibacillus consociatus TaxID=1117041 RepID=A0ABV9PYN1_9BACL
MNEKDMIQAYVSTPLGRHRIRFRLVPVWLSGERRLTLVAELRDYFLRQPLFPENPEPPQNTGRIVETYIREQTGLIGEDLQQVSRIVYWELFGWSVLEPYLADPEITDVVANAHEIWVQRKGEKIQVPARFQNEEHITYVARKIAHAAGQSLTTGQPFVTCYVRGMRVNLMLPPVADNGTTIIIRKYRANRWTEQEYVQSGTLNREVWQLLAAAMEAGVTGIISGPVGSGKTTLLQSLVAFIPDGDGILVAETVPELQLKKLYPNKCILSVVPRLRGHEASRITLEQLFENALHQNMRRFLFGEIRGTEASLVLEAFQTGHSGWTTMHADNPQDALQRLVAMCLRTDRQLNPEYTEAMVTKAVDLIVQMHRYRVTEVAEVIQDPNRKASVVPLFRYREGRWDRLNRPSPTLMAKLKRG